MENVLSKQQEKDSWFWLAAAGLFALALSLFVFWADETLSHSQGEKRLGATLKELRTAQSSYPSASDPRQLGDIGVEQRLSELEKSK